MSKGLDLLKTPTKLLAVFIRGILEPLDGEGGAILGDAVTETENFRSGSYMTQLRNESAIETEKAR